MANSLSSILFLAKQRSTFNKSNMIDNYSTKFGFSFLFDHFIRIILIIMNPIQQWIHLSIEKYRKLFANELRKHSLRLIISAIVVIIQLLWFTSYYFDHHHDDPPPWRQRPQYWRPVDHPQVHMESSLLHYRDSYHGLFPHSLSEG